MELMKNIVTQAAVRTTPRPLLEFSEAIGLFLVVDKQQRRQGDCPFVSYWSDGVLTPTSSVHKETPLFLR